MDAPDDGEPPVEEVAREDPRVEEEEAEAEDEHLDHLERGQVLLPPGILRRAAAVLLQI